MTSRASRRYAAAPFDEGAQLVIGSPATVVSRTVRFPETTVAGRPITSYDPSSGGAQAYRQLARELLARWA